MAFSNFPLLKKNCVSYLIVLFFVFFSFSNTAYGVPEISVTTQGIAVKAGNDLIQNIILSFKADSAWKISVLSLDNSLKNLNQPTQQIPINNVFILNNLLSDPYYFEPNKTIQIDSGESSGIFNKKYNLRIASSETAYPGIYTGIFKFTLTSGSDVATYIYTLSFQQPEIQKINIIPDALYIKVLPYDAMKKGYTFSTNSPTRILIKSNSNWKLVLKNNAGKNSLNCKFKVSSSSEKAKINYGLDYTDLPDNNLIIAEGSPTISPDGKTFDTEVIQVNYMFKTAENEVQSSDDYTFDVNYELIPE